MPSVTNRVADFDIINTNHRSDISGGGHFGVDSAELIEELQVCDLGCDYRVFLGDIDLLPLLHRAGLDSADGDPSDVIGPIKVGYKQLQWGFGFDIWPGDFLDHHIEQRHHVFSWHFPVERCVAGASRCVDNIEVIHIVFATDVD